MAQKISRTSHLALPRDYVEGWNIKFLPTAPEFSEQQFLWLYLPHYSKISLLYVREPLNTMLAIK